jgi:hypothetical protein
MSVVWRWDGLKLQFFSRAQSDWAENWWTPWVSSFDCFLYCKQTKEQKIAEIAVLQNMRFHRLAESN